MIVPHTLLSAQTLKSLIEEFVTRNGAVHGEADLDVATKIQSVHDQLENGHAEIMYDDQQQNWTIVARPG